MPLKIARASGQEYERRIYFDFDAGASLTLYYDDGQLDAPVYDYAKLFQSDANAEQVPVGTEKSNAGYTGRPDDRPSPLVRASSGSTLDGNSRGRSDPWRISRMVAEECDIVKPE